MNNSNTRNRKSMRKLVMLLFVLFAMIGPANAQVFMMNDNGSRNGISHEELSDLNIPFHLENYDQAYAPLGNGLILLAALGGAYLFGKKRKE